MMTKKSNLSINFSSRMRSTYSTAIIGSLIMKIGSNNKKNDFIEEKKRQLETELQKGIINPKQDDMINYYNQFFKRWGKTYPVEYQIKTIAKGGRLPQVSVLVDSMFLAELGNRVLTSGHNMDEIQGNLEFDVTEGNERYLKINGKTQVLKKDDIVLKDDQGILASLLYGPAKRTTIDLNTESALFLAWCPYKLNEKTITQHLNQILRNLNQVYPSSPAVLDIHF